MVPSKQPFIFRPENAGIDLFVYQARHMLRARNPECLRQLEAHFGMTQQEMADFLIEYLPISEPGECLADFGGCKGTPAERFNAMAAYLNAGCGAVPSSVGADA